MFFRSEMKPDFLDNDYSDAIFREAFDRMLQDVDAMDEKWMKEKDAQMQYLSQRADQYGGGKIMRHGNELRAFAQDLLKLAAFSPKAKISVIKTGLSILLKSPWRFQARFDNWRSDLWTADIGVSVSLIYHFVQNELSETERKAILEKIRESSFEPLYDDWLNPETRIHVLDSMGHNWWTVCIAGAGITLLTAGIFSVTDYNQKLSAVTDALCKWFLYPGNTQLNKRPNFGEDGDYAEYVAYLNYALSNYSLFFSMLEKEDSPIAAQCFHKLINADKILEKTPDFILENLLWGENGLQCGDFGDCNLGRDSMHGFYFLCARYSRNDLLEAIGKLHTPHYIYEMFFYPEQTSVRRDLPLMAVYPVSGHGVIRTGFGEKDAAFIIKSGESWNHNHLDAGTFEFSVYGEKWITDSGTVSYSNPLYLDYFTRPCAHNSILFDGEGPWEGMRYEGTKYPGTFTDCFQDGHYKYMVADCTGPYRQLLQRYYRHVLAIGKNIFLIDDVQSFHDGTIESLFHINGTPEFDGNSVTLDNGKNRIFLFFPFVKEEAFRQETGYLHSVPNGPDELVPEGNYFSCSYQTEKCRAKGVTILWCDEIPPQIETSRTDTALKLTVSTRDGSFVLLINCRADGSVMHQNGWNSIDGIETDAFLTLLEYDSNNALSAFSVHNGSTLRYHHHVLFSSDFKENVRIQLTNTEV